MAKAGVLEDFEVGMGAAPHHIIPGNAAMAPSDLEKWTCASKGMIKEDIGYSIDCANNGIFLPHLPEIYWTKQVQVEVEREGGRETRKLPMSEYFGQTWLGLSDSSKQSIGYLIMGETSLQMHYTDHSAAYAGSTLSYDTETKEACDQLNDLMDNLHFVCERSKDDDGKHKPPYALVHRINRESAYFRGRITGRPDRWASWVSPLANAYTQALATGRERLVIRNLVSRKLRGTYNRRMAGSTSRRRGSRRR